MRYFEDFDILVIWFFWVYKDINGILYIFKKLLVFKWFNGWKIRINDL